MDTRSHPSTFSRIVAGATLFGALAACGGGGDADSGTSYEPYASSPTSPASPTYTQQIVALMSGTYDMECSSIAGSTATKRRLLVAQDGVLRVSGVADVDFTLDGASFVLEQSWAEHPSYNTLSPGVYFAGQSGQRSSELLFILNTDNVLFRTLDYRDIARGVVMSCRGATSTGSPEFNRANWTAPAYFDTVAHASAIATCGTGWSVDLGAGAKVYERVTVPGISAPQGAQGFTYFAQWAEAKRFEIGVVGINPVERTGTFNGATTCSL